MALLKLLYFPTLQTLQMVIVSGLFSALGGMILGVLLVATEKGNVLEVRWLQRLLSAVTNIGRSLPFIILMVAIIPFTRWVVGSAIGTTAAIVPLVVGTIPYVARLVESALKEVDHGVIEAALTMGATPLQVINKVYLPESVPALIRALTVVMITLVSYSAMAGAVGGGGLGDLAIRCGYQGFRIDVMVSTVILLILLIQGIQWTGDRVASHFERRDGTVHRKRTWNGERCLRWAATAGVLGIGGILVFAGLHSRHQPQPLRIGVSPIPHGEILEHVLPQLRAEGVDVQAVYFNDYIQPNLALAAGDLDANFFQHIPFMEQFNRDHGTNIVSVGKVHIEPLGLYPGRMHSLAALPDGATIAVPNDPVNRGRALLLLQSAGLIVLKTGWGTRATLQDIDENLRHLRIRELEAAQLPRALQDLDAAVINTNYALAAHLNPLKDAFFLENSRSPYANIVATVPGKTKDLRIVKVVDALKSQEAKEFIEEKYKGAVIPTF